ncbi:MAG TPA: S8 family serine peptidase [Myxococcales bacterium]|nr:S8 family serine peptidase [Myxococcales bacterium]
MPPLVRKNGVSAALFCALALSRAATAVPNVTQVIDGVPQVIAPQQIVIRCDPTVLSTLCTAALDAVGAVLAVTGLSGFNLAILPDGLPLQNALDALRVSSAISSAEPNRILIGSTAYPQTWHFPAMDAPGDDTLLPKKSKGLIVAVLDTGIAYQSREDWNGNSYASASALDSTRFVQGWDFVNDDPFPDDDNGHGTAMATIIAGNGSFSSAGVPYVGPAAGASLMAVKVLDADNKGTEFWLEEGIRYAVGAGADVINLSLDFARNYIPGAALRDALAYARDGHVVIVAASGNTAGRVLYPAAFPDVISVGALGLDAVSGYAVTWYSNRGEALDLVAPGGLPGQDVNQDGLWDGVLAQSFPPGAPSQISWWLFAGTSPAAAHASAAAAALIGNGVDPGTVRPLLQATAAEMGATGWDSRSGSGRLQASTAIASASSYVPPAQLYADAVAALRADGRAAGAVMIATASGVGVSNAEVHVHWRGAATASQTAVTDGQGIARFVSPWPSSSRKLFVIEVPRVIYAGAAQRPRAFARSGGVFSGLNIGLNLSLGGTNGGLDGLDIWGYGYSEGIGLASGTTGSGLASGTTGSTGNGQDGTYPLTTGIQGCPIALPLYSYSWLSFSASSALFSGAFLANGFSARLVDSSWVLAPGAAALDAREVARICGLSVSLVKSLSSSFFWSGTLYTAGVGPQPPGLGIGDNARFWADVMNAERSTAP